MNLALSIIQISMATHVGEVIDLKTFILTPVLINRLLQSILISLCYMLNLE